MNQLTTSQNLTLDKLLNKSPYQAYVYSYPHKTSYRPLNPPLRLKNIWEKEKKDALFLYIHIPFCEMRCGFCNLFTTVSKNEELFNQYINTVKKQAEIVKQELGNISFSRFALGGGTPTQLSIKQLEETLNIAENTFNLNLKIIPSSVEVSPETATKAKLSLLKQRGIQRISIGIQSFIDNEVLAIQRKQNQQEVKATLNLIKEFNFPILNIDLIYGLPEQTLESWLDSLKETIAFQPEEIYLYPLYIRPLTGIDKTDKQWDDIRLLCYRKGCQFLVDNGYQQVSMRMFRLCSNQIKNSPIYCCQSDGMIGLGCGARSYTTNLHYSNEYAVDQKNIINIIDQYINTEPDLFRDVDNGFILNQDEQKRRYILISLLSEEGINLEKYQKLFSSNLLLDFADLKQLLKYELAYQKYDVIKLTLLGLEKSDIIGYWLFSSQVISLMNSYQLK